MARIPNSGAAVALLFLLVLLVPVLEVRGQEIPEGSAEAVWEFAQGMSLYVSMDYQEALHHLYQAHELDSGFVLPLFFAALCEGNLGSGVPVDSLYRIVLEHRDRLSPYYVYRAESQLAQRMGDRPKALEFAWKAANLAPGSKAWYNVAYMENRLNRPGEARAALLKLDPSREPMKGWAAYFAELARANEALGRFEEVLQNAADMREAFPDSRAPFWWEVNAYGAMGDVAGLESVLQAAGANPATGEGNTVGAYMVLAAAELKGHGHTQEGMEMYRRAVDWYESQGNGAAGRAHSLWHTLALLGAEALPEAMTQCEKWLGVNPDDTWYHVMAGILAGRMRDQDRLNLEKAYLAEQGPNRPQGWLPFQMAYVEANAGEASAAVASLQEAMTLGYAFNPWWHRDPAFDLIRDHPDFRELIRPKG